VTSTRITGVIGGTIVGVLAVAATTLAAGAGHGTYFPAKVLFPYSMLLTSLTDTITPTLLGVAAAQWPLYGYIVSGRRSRWPFVAAMHSIAVVASLFFSDPSFLP
jgi:hypothetical protein